MPSVVIVWVVVTLVFSILMFILGYIAGRVDSILSSLGYSPGFSSESRKSSLKSQNKRAISIDDSKVVVDVDTSYVKSESFELGEKTVSADDINSAKQKLSQLKRGK